jgi:Ca2+-binding EF-hand superfamily protein
MRRYDRNRDGFLSKDELARFSGNPMDFDRNRDGKLSSSELAVRYARRREGEEAAKQSQTRDRRTDRRRESKAEIPDVYNGRRSFRDSSGKALPDGLPGFFADRDKNGDGQVSLAEYADEFNESVVAKFMESDLNNDGVIIPSEALRAIEQGGASSAAAGMTSMSRKLDSMSSRSKPTSSSAGGEVDEKFVKVAERIVKRYDKNGNGELTAAEWSTMLMSPAAADANRDGKITINEYASWMKSREKKR